MGRAKAAYLLLCAFLSGAAVMIVEMTAVRLLQPWFGSTNDVWTNVIAVVLAALALGYFLGGRLAEKRPVPSTLYGVLATGGLLVVLMVPLATPTASWLQPGTADLEGVVGVLVRGSLVASIVLFAPAMLVLGAVSPVTIRLLADHGAEQHTSGNAAADAGGGAGRAAGRVFAISTLGSLVGTYLPTHWLVPEFGSRRSMLVAAAFLLLPAVVGLLLHTGRRGAVVAAILVAVGAPVAAAADARPDRAAPELARGGKATVLAEVETPYQYVTVRDDRYPSETQRLLTINEGVYTYHSFEVVGKVLTGARYYDDYSVLPLLVDVPDGDELRGAVVGLACGVTPSQWNHFWGRKYRLSVDGAEIDPVVMELGRKYFHLPAENDANGNWLHAFAMDGRQMLAGLPPARRYHLVVVDAFSNELYIPFHLGTREFFRLCRDRLEPGGVFAMNVYAQRPDSPNLAALENTLADAFGSCLRVRQYWGGNFLLLARRGDAPPDLTRLVPSRIDERVGARKDVPEWAGVVDLAARMPWHATIIHPDPAKMILTDDHAPLEHLTDVFLDRAESELLR
ncbi:MAG: fused MFS/spermidine synthase [Planctomycetes bacterium]|nr:fused MFS/spermidine synthase [Planctomycetota bacterium]